MELDDVLAELVAELRASRKATHELREEVARLAKEFARASAHGAGEPSPAAGATRRPQADATAEVIGNVTEALVRRIIESREKKKGK